jgi:integrase
MRTAVKKSNKLIGSYEKAYNCWETEAKGTRITTQERYLNTIKSLAHFLNSKPIGLISKKDISEFSIHLIKSGNSPVTSKQKVGILKTIFNSAINHELIDKNPIEHFKLPYKRPHKPRVGFTLTDLELIFSSPIYTQGYLPLGGGKIACYWLPLLALFTGARLEELAQLQVSDIQKAKDLGYYLTITDLGDTGAQLKNSHSRRNIPIHPVLIACGFMEHVKNRERGYLFPDLKINPRGKRSGYFSNWFSTYLRKKIGIKDTRKVFHSFRHTFKDICRNNGIEEAIHDALTGHKSPSVSREYGNDQFPLAPLFKAIEQFDIPELDLSHLHEQPLAQTIKTQDLKIVSAFYGIVVGFIRPQSRKPQPPTLVAMVQAQTAGFDLITGALLFGEIPESKRPLLNAWIHIHHEELLMNCQTGIKTGEYFPIDPLR